MQSKSISKDILVLSVSVKIDVYPRLNLCLILVKFVYLRNLSETIVCILEIFNQIQTCISARIPLLEATYFKALLYDDGW